LFVGGKQGPVTLFNSSATKKQRDILKPTEPIPKNRLIQLNHQQPQVNSFIFLTADFYSQYTETITSIRSVNSTDAMTLLRNFGVFI
jgi:hypothetical protein